MGRIFITGSAEGLGQLAAGWLVADGHEVVLHARDERRGRDAVEGVAGAAGVVTGDLGSIEEAKQVAAQVNALGGFDAVIHNAGVYRTSPDEIFHVNVLAPYILTCLVEPPQRLVYMSSGMHLGGSAKLDSFKTDVSRISYSDSKLHVLMLAIAVARRWRHVYSNAVDPGWVPTKMGGAGATDDLQEGVDTQVWLAASDDDAARVSGRYFHHKRVTRHNPEADDANLQDRFLEVCGELTGVFLPE